MSAINSIFALASKLVFFSDQLLSALHFRTVEILATGMAKSVINLWYFCWTVILCLQIQFFRTTQTADHNVITVKSKYSVKNTIDLIENDIKQQNGTIFCRIDQKKAAELAGIVGQLDDTELILFGNPKIGTQLMVANGTVSIELPMRAACWKQNGTVYLSVTNPRALEVPYNLSSKMDVLQKMNDNIIQMINKVGS